MKISGVADSGSVDKPEYPKEFKCSPWSSASIASDLSTDSGPLLIAFLEDAGGTISRG